MNENKEILQNLGFVLSSFQRKRILLEIGKGPTVPRELSASLELSLSHISRSLSELQTHNIIECVNPQMKKGRVYRLTAIGEELLQMISFRDNISD